MDVLTAEHYFIINFAVLSVQVSFSSPPPPLFAALYFLAYIIFVMF